MPVHAGAQGGEFMINERLIDSREPLGWCLDGSGAAPMRELEAGPRPFHRVLDQLSADRIAEHGAKGRKEMRNDNKKKYSAVALNRLKPFLYPLRVPSSVDDGENGHSILLHQVKDFVGEPFDEMSTDSTM